MFFSFFQGGAMQEKLAKRRKLVSRKAPSLILNNSVAEIWMAEWKTVDKEIWLRIFETEEVAARALDVARKLLRCKKKWPVNFPCIELVAYLEHIPPNLNLKNLGNGAMFKDVTLGEATVRKY
jgi:hypothetical protein